MKCGVKRRRCIAIRLRHGLLLLKTPIKRKALSRRVVVFCSFFPAGSERTGSPHLTFTLIKKLRPGPCRWLLANSGNVDGFYASGARISSLIGGTLLKLLRLVLRPASCVSANPGEQTDVPESADWYNSSQHHRLGFKRAADARTRMLTFTEVRYKGTKTVAAHTRLR